MITKYKTMIDKSAAKLSGGGNFKKNPRRRNFKLGRRRCKSSSENEVDDDCIEEYNEDDFFEENFPRVDQENTSGSATESMNVIDRKSVQADRVDIKTEERCGSSCSSSLVKLDTSEEGKASGCDLDNVCSVAVTSDSNLDQKTSLTCSFCLCVCSNLQMCSRCQVTSYCGSKCQKEDWYKGHRHQCNISNVVTRSPTRKERIKSVFINSQPEYESSHRRMNNVDEKILPKSILKRKLPSNECEETSHGANCKNIQLQDKQVSDMLLRSSL